MCLPGGRGGGLDGCGMSSRWWTGGTWSMCLPGGVGGGLEGCGVGDIAVI